MNLVNATKMQTAFVMGLDANGRELLIVAIKGTFTIPKDGMEPELAEIQAPLVYADEFTGEPGFSAIRYEYDFCTFKPRCDVLLNGSAYAPKGKPVKRVTVALEVGRMKKRFNVVGNRVWKRGWILRAKPSRPKPFRVMPISYDNAYGGVDNLHPKPRKHLTYLPNFAGQGYFPRSRVGDIKGKPVPNTEEVWTSIKRAGRKYRPMAFGSLGRAWVPRREFAGTYDQKWIDHTFPFLPKDFDPRYNQSAPADQQIDYIRGGEAVTLTHLMPQSPITFRLPTIDMPVLFTRKSGEETEIHATNDTLLLEPDLNRFILVWRAVLPLKRNIFEMDQVIVGRMPSAWYRARATGKHYFSSLQEFIVEKEQQVKALADAHEEVNDTEKTQEMEDIEELLEAPL